MSQMHRRQPQRQHTSKIEFILGGLATSGAGFFTNPLEVVKTRMQLQGELKAKGQYPVHYRHVFHAFYTIARNDGIKALQKGLVPALWYQFFMNGVRLGTFQAFDNMGFTRNRDGHVSFYKSVCVGALAGCIGAIVGSPFYMVSIYFKYFLESVANYLTENKFLFLAERKGHKASKFWICYKIFSVLYKCRISSAF